MASESEDKKEGNKEDNGAEASRPNDEDVTSTNSEINSIVVTIIVSIICSRILGHFDRIAPALAAPAAALYLMSTCPRDESFDAMREFKRVLRGDRLYDDHPDKPKVRCRLLARAYEYNILCFDIMSSSLILPLSPELFRKDLGKSQCYNTG